MMGISHATSGAVAGLALTHLAPQVVGVHSPRDAFAFAAVTAGYALLPDLDHRSSLATRRFSWASRLASHIVRPVSRAVFALTSTRRDDGSREHRGITHTAVAAMALVALVSHAAGHWGPPAVWVTVFLGLSLAVKGIDHLIPGPPSLFVGAVLTYGCLGELPGLGVTSAALRWEYAIGLGVVVHCLGDALTKSGCSFLWPVPIAGKLWYPVRTPSRLRISTGGVAERLILGVLTASALWLGIITVPGAEVIIKQLLPAS